MHTYNIILLCCCHPVHAVTPSSATCGLSLRAGRSVWLVRGSGGVIPPRLVVGTVQHHCVHSPVASSLVRQGVKMEPIPVEAPGSAGRYLGSLYFRLTGGRRSEGAAGRRPRGRAGTSAADWTSVVVAGLSSGQAQLVSCNVIQCACVCWGL